MIAIFIYICILISYHTLDCQNFSPTITLSNGQLRGTVNKTAINGKTYYAFRGIPFAKKPLGDLRFAAPVPNDPWTGVLDAVADRDACTQLNILEHFTKESNVVGSEDCLYINVYTTDLKGTLPVMVWVYGGTFWSGSSRYEEFAPDYLLEKDVLYVAFNYRLGVFGFLSTEDDVAPGNWGLKDQILAMKWVKKNVAAFGGDPEKITVFGQSAGAASLSYLLNSKLTEGLYRAAIMQSGNALCTWTLTRQAKSNADKLGLLLGILPTDSKTLVKRLREVDYKKLKVVENLATFSIWLSGNIINGFPFAVVQEPEHEGAVLSGRSYQILESGNFVRVPAIVGFTSFEVAPGIHINLLLRIFAIILLNLKIKPLSLAPYDLTKDLFKKILAGTMIRYKYFKLSPLGLNEQDAFKWATVDEFNRPIREAATLMSKYTDVYYYKFSYQGRLGNPNRTEPGVQHAEDLKYIFYTNATVSPEDALTIKRMVTMWTNFAKTRNPTLSDESDVLKITWVPNTPHIDAEKNITYLNINNTLALQENPDQDDWLFYQNIFKDFGDPSYYVTY
ncbi:hypothetical protein GWI33_004747 [Rhynchophorus ferrugineus]|uniref:Carboxylic ester hydrolase n=1 Tax=Rhynchophorus ferrugineus TaxID=354439 RepID=A0A834IWW9_RHYFE|nr:hypothetical protein GWI33_004747 [Rhynchophorus ferrugineus]